MVSVFRYSEISESNNRILNPLSESKLFDLGEICRLQPGERHLDLACGKGEMLCQFARRHGTLGLGIDIYPPFLAAARSRAAELGVDASVVFQEGDASKPGAIGGDFDIVSCIGATWIGGGLAGTLELMRRRARPGGWILVGEVYWAQEPPTGVRQVWESAQSFADLTGTLDRFDAGGVELVETLLASTDEWDRYQASQWLAASDWLAANPNDADALEVRRSTDEWRRSYLTDLRRCLGWGVFVLRDR
ncbi:MAG: SAM-dependent methyltransferase [Acidimicrobiales bacterium]